MPSSNTGFKYVYLSGLLFQMNFKANYLQQQPHSTIYKIETKHLNMFLSVCHRSRKIEAMNAKALPVTSENIGYDQRQTSLSWKSSHCDSKIYEQLVFTCFVEFINLKGKIQSALNN